MGRFIFLSLLFLSFCAFGAEPAGVVVVHNEPSDSGRFIGSPSFVKIGGVYYASHDFFGPNSGEREIGISRVYRSIDKGETWEFCSEIQGAFWARLLNIGGKLYLFGPDKNPTPSKTKRVLKDLSFGLIESKHADNRVLLRRSEDGGKTWTKPQDENSGIILQNGHYGCAPTPSLERNGYLYLALGSRFMRLNLAAENPLAAASWELFPNSAVHNMKIGEEKHLCHECGVITLPNGALGMIGKMGYYECGDDRAGVFVFDEKNKKTLLYKRKGVFPMLGGRIKFTVCYDDISKKYWSLTNFLPEEDYGEKADLRRNTLALVSSSDLEKWELNCIIFHSPDVVREGWQYVHLEVEGDDIIALSRTALKDAAGYPPRGHDANFLTFHRIKDFRKLTPADSCSSAKERLSKTLKKYLGNIEK